LTGAGSNIGSNGESSPRLSELGYFDHSSHLVQFYERDDFLLNTLSRWAAEGLGAGDAIVFIATEAHRQAFDERLRAVGLDVLSLRAEGRLVVLDAADTLSEFMVDELPSEARFEDVIGGVIARAERTENGAPTRNVRAFGEMVAILWARGKPEAAIRLEELWNRLAEKRSFSLCCAYPLNTFRNDADGKLFLKVCAEHSRVIPAESYSALASDDERLRSISHLQLKARILETETASRMEAEQSLRRLEDELKTRLAEADQRLADADHHKDEFLAMLGHELRNPLSAVLHGIATAQLDDSRRPHALDIARRQTNQLAGLINDLLDVSRITQGRIELRKQLVGFAGIVRETVEESRPMTIAAHQLLVVSVAPDAENAPLEIDSTRIRQVIGNLVHNASKFTPPGGSIEVTVERKDGGLAMRVRDSGVGIAPEMLPRVFDLFAQASTSLDRAKGGLGIGLTLVKRLVEMHDGRVQARSGGLGTGSEFEVWLPMLRDGIVAAAAGPQSSKMPALKRILIVEDNVDTAEAMTILLELRGHSVTVAANGASAIDAAGSGGFDAALVDIGLPDLDGYEVAQRIRALPACKSMMLAALTGYGQEEDRQRALAAGFDQHLTKPVKVELLNDLLGRLE
jgi:signal transduction histidine kinase